VRGDARSEGEEEGGEEARWCHCKRVGTGKGTGKETLLLFVANWKKREGDNLYGSASKRE
jgi:hypothetical protein